MGVSSRILLQRIGTGQLLTILCLFILCSRANDAGSLGRITNIEGEDSDELEATPGLVESLREEGFKTVKLSAGDSHSVAISDQGQLRAWGSFRVSRYECYFL